MTKNSLEKMIYGESLFCIAKAVILSGALGILLPWLINCSLRILFPVRYEFPAVSFFAGVILVAVIVIGITTLELLRLMKQNIIEDIRMDFYNS